MNTVADIAIKYVNPVKPGKKMAVIKDDGGQMYLVRPAMLPQFAQGMKCKIEFSARTGSDGTEWRTIEKVIGNGGAPVMPQNNFRQRSNPAEAKQIAVLAMAKSWLDKIPVGDEDAAVHAINTLMRVYDKTLAANITQRRDDMDDQIPY